MPIADEFWHLHFLFESIYYSCYLPYQTPQIISGYTCLLLPRVHCVVLQLFCSLSQVLRTCVRVVIER